MLRLLCVFGLWFGLVGCEQPYDAEAAKIAYEARVQEQKAAALVRGEEIVAACRANECTKLDLDGARLTDFSVLNDMPHVTKLMMSRTNFADLADISEMTQLTELHISNTEVSDLSGLSAFRNLTLLHVNYMREDPDYAPVYRLRGLKELSIDRREGDGLGFVRNMGQLKALFLFGYDNVDLSPLNGNRTIEHLYFDTRVPADATPILGMRNLRLLHAGTSSVSPEIQTELEGKGVTVQWLELPPVC